MPEDRSKQDVNGEIAFGDYSLDLSRGTLRHFDQDIDLRAQSFAVLLYLAQHRGVLVSKDELLHAVWHDTPVTDDSITQCILEIRKAINDKSRTIIRTVPKRGFLFDADAQEPGVASKAGNENRTGIFDASWERILIAIGLAGAAFFLWVTYLSTDSQVVPAAENFTLRANTIAVLAFDDMSEQQDQQYLADGIAEDILTRLAQSPDMTVVARTSSFKFRNKPADIRAIARDLDVSYILEGSVRRSERRIRITAQLIETAGGTHVWSESYDRELTTANILDIQSDVAALVVNSVLASTPLAGGSLRSINSTDSTEAYEQYLEGMFFLRQIQTTTGTDFDAAIDRFEKAISLDPMWATPQAALGSTLHFRATSPGVDDRAYWYRLAKQHVLMSIELDPLHAPAYASLAFILFKWEMDFAGAEAAYAKADELGLDAVWGKAMMMGRLGRFDESIALYKRAIARDPLAMGPKVQLALTLMCNGQYAQSFAMFETLQEIIAEPWDYNPVMAVLQLRLGDIERSRAILQLPGQPESAPGDNALIYALSGMRKEANAALDAAEAASGWHPRMIASTAILLGQRDRALQYLEAAAESEPNSFSNIMCSPEIRSLSGDPRFERILRTAGYPR